MAGKKSTDKEIESRIEFTMFLLGQGYPKGKIKTALKEKYQCHTRTCEIYIARARTLLLEQTQRPKEELFSEADSFYRTVLQQPQVSMRDKLIARQRLDTLYGLDAPKTHQLEHSAKNGGPVEQIVFYIPDNGRDGNSPASRATGEVPPKSQ